MSSLKELEELDHLRIPLKEIESATNNFGDGSFIGVGAFGRVYKAELSHNNVRSSVAIKRLNSRGYQGEKEFVTEIAMLSGYKHKNLVSLLGFCDEGREKILVYKYEAHGSLDKYLRNTNDGHNLTWIQLLNICVGAAHGLNYLHNGVGAQLRVIHRDIKSANILLDENWEAKIADFGLSKFSPANQKNTFLFTGHAGTIAYCDPQYWNTNILTKESDVYSFGVVLFEVLCGRLAYHDGGCLAPVAREHYEHKNLDEIIDRNIRDQIEADSLKIFSEIAYQCLQELRKNRPTMTQVVRALENALVSQLRIKRLQPSIHLDYPSSFAPGFGVYYGNDLPLPSEVIRLCKSHNIQQMRLYSPNQAVLQSLRGSDIRVMVGIPNPDIEHVASSLDNAKKWVQENVIDYRPDVRFHYIVVGNEDEMDGGIASQIQYIYGAMKNLHKVIELNGLQDAIKVSTAVDITNLFDDPFSSYDFEPILSFSSHINNDNPLLLKLFPYHSYGSTPGVISLPYDPNPIEEGRVHSKFKDMYTRCRPLREALYSSLEEALEAGVGSFDVEKALKKLGFNDRIIKDVEPGIYFRGDKYIFCFFLHDDDITYIY